MTTVRIQNDFDPIRITCIISHGSVRSEDTVIKSFCCAFFVSVPPCKDFSVDGIRLRNLTNVDLSIILIKIVSGHTVLFALLIVEGDGNFVGPDSFDCNVFFRIVSCFINVDLRVISCCPTFKKFSFNTIIVSRIMGNQSRFIIQALSFIAGSGNRGFVVPFVIDFVKVAAVGVKCDRILVRVFVFSFAESYNKQGSENGQDKKKCCRKSYSFSGCQCVCFFHS